MSSTQSVGTNEEANPSITLHHESTRGVLHLDGPDGRDLLNRISTNDLRHLGPGQVLPTLLTTDKGKLIDLVYVVQLDFNHIVLVTSQGSESQVTAWINKFIIMESVTVSSASPSVSVLALIGGPFDDLHFVVKPGCVGTFPELPGSPTVFMPDTPGEPTLFCLTEKGGEAEFLNFVQSSSAIAQYTDEAFERYRICRGIAAFGKEIVESFNPYDVGLLFAVSYSKGCYIGQEVIARIDTYQKSRKRLATIVFNELIVRPRLPATLKRDEEEVGTLTSLSFEFVDKKTVALGVIRKEVSDGDSVQLLAHDRVYEGIIFSPPLEPQQSTGSQ